MSKDGSRRDQTQFAQRNRSTGGRGKTLPILVLVALVIFTYFVATRVSSFVADLFIHDAV